MSKWKSWKLLAAGYALIFLAALAAIAYIASIIVPYILEVTK